jgi:hypothetical protein
MIQVVKYLLEGLAVSFASHLVAGNKLDIKEIITIGVTAAAVFLVLEHFAPSIVAGARQGAGFGIGYKLVNEGYHNGQHGGYYEDEEEVVHLPNEDQSVPSPNSPYKLVDGVYSAKVLLSGFNENAKACNNDNNCKTQSAYPWDGDATGQTGGAGAESEESESALKPVSESEAKVSAESAPVVPIEHDDNYRKADALYSGDLIDITSGGNYLQRGTIDSQIIFDAPLAKVGTNLSKLRVVHPKHSSTKQMVLNYGEPVYIMHNAYFNNMNQGKFIKYGERLQSHQDGPLFRAFKIYDADNKDKKGAVEPGTELYLCRGDQEGDNVYLKVESDKSVTSKNPLNSASRFKLSLKRVFEAHDRNLCVCPNEIIYP